MAYEQPTAPHVNGIPEWVIKYDTDGETINPNYDEARVTDTKAKLQAVADGFTPTAEQPEISHFYIVATFNRENAGSEINGDTAAVILDGVELTSNQIKVDIVG